MLVSWDAIADANNAGSAVIGYTATAIEGTNTFFCTAAESENLTNHCRIQVY